MQPSTQRLADPSKPANVKPLAILFLALLATLPTTAVALAEGEATASGPELFTTHKCMLCHGVEAAGIEAKTKSAKMAGPDVSGFTTDDVAALAGYLRKQSERDGVAHKREFEGTDEELQTILDWLGSLEASDLESTDSEGAGDVGDGR